MAYIDENGLTEILTKVKTYVTGLLAGKQDKLTAGDNITISNNVISSAGGGTSKTKLSEFTDDLGSSPTHTHSQYMTKSDTTGTMTLNTTYASSGSATWERVGNVVTLHFSLTINFSAVGTGTQNYLLASGCPKPRKTPLITIMERVANINPYFFVGANGEVYINNQYSKLTGSLAYTGTTTYITLDS